MEIDTLSEVSLLDKFVVDCSFHSVTRVGSVAPEGGRVEFSHSVSNLLVSPGDELTLVVLLIFSVQLAYLRLSEAILN